MNAPLSIVHMLPALDKGGAERVVVDLANLGVAKGHEVSVLVGWKVDERLLRVRLNPAVKVIYMAESPGGKGRRYAFALFWMLRNLGWIARKDVLHLHLTQASLLGTVVYILRNATRKPKPAVVETYHSVGMKISDRLRAIHAWSSRHRDVLVLMALDPYWRGFMARNPKLKVEFIPNGVDAPIGPATQAEVNDYLAQIGMPGTATRIIGTVGGFRPSRLPETLARILIDVLKQTSDDVHALMCGGGSELGKVCALVEAEGMAHRFVLPGLVNEPRVAMSAMSVYLTVNVGEITGIAALEAAFCAVPVVAFQMDSSVKPSNENWIWASAEPEAVADSIVSLLAEPDERARIAEKQHAHVIAEYSAESMHRKYIDCYRRAIDARRGS